MTTRSIIKSRAAPSSARRNPSQTRALSTVDAIFDATAQILERQGEDRLNTNRIAKTAGVSIGTLYQYFPDKNAILLALINRERRRVLDTLQEMLKSAADENKNVAMVVREMIHLLIESFGTGSGNRGAIVRVAWRMDHLENITQALREASEANAIALSRLRDDSLRSPSPAMMFVATRAVMGAIRSASLEASPLLGTIEFEDELVRLVMSLIRLP